MSHPSPSPAGGLRGVARASVRDHVAAQALRLFDERGFDATTVDDIAAEVGMSPRTFFRYFASKEDVVVGDPTLFGTIVRDAAAARPAGEPAWSVLRQAFVPIQENTASATEAGLRSMRVLMSTASLRARNAEKHSAWAAMLEPIITAHLGGDPKKARYRALTLIGAALACLDAALAEWTEREGSTPLADLLDESFEILLDA